MTSRENSLRDPEQLAYRSLFCDGSRPEISYFTPRKRLMECRQTKASGETQLRVAKDPQTIVCQPPSQGLEEAPARGKARRAGTNFRVLARFWDVSGLGTILLLAFSGSCGM